MIAPIIAEGLFIEPLIFAKAGLGLPPERGRRERREVRKRDGGDKINLEVMKKV
jgi:hypothetical protein